MHKVSEKLCEDHLAAVVEKNDAAINLEVSLGSKGEPFLLTATDKEDSYKEQD